MRIEQLHIGNWVNTPKGIGRVFGIKRLLYAKEKHLVYVMLERKREEWECDDFWIDEITQIPLTPEVLEKSGFEKHFNFSIEGENTWHNGYVILSKDGDMWSKCGKFPVRIHTVDELQNAFYSVGEYEMADEIVVEE